MYNYLVLYIANAIGYRAYGICTVTVPNLISSNEDEALIYATKSKLSNNFSKCNLNFEFNILDFHHIL